MQEYKGRPVEHLGDGVYAVYSYTGIWLYANDHVNPTDKIFIEPSVLRNLITFEKKAADWVARERKQVLCPKCSGQIQLASKRGSGRRCLKCGYIFNK